ncbi:MAG: ExbD/TolR family protein [Bacteroidia bacterium]
MAKFKAKRMNIAIDMTPMVDLAFLLITFFMLTVKFRPQESVEVKVPSSIADTPLPATDILLITISQDGRVFLGVDSKHTRLDMLQRISERYGYDFSENEKRLFGILSEVPVPLEMLKSYLSLSEMERQALKLPGVPVDSARNQLADWIVYARLSNPKLRIAVKADENTPYEVVRRVIETLQEKKINRFNLVTQLEVQNQTIQ